MKCRLGMRLVVGMLILLGMLSLSATAGAVPGEPIVPEPEPGDDDGGSGGGGTYEPPGGFTWSRASRFASTTPANFRWNPVTATYDTNWVRMEGGFPVQVDGCRAPEGTSGYTYKWEKLGAGGTRQVLSGPNAECQLELKLPEGA